MARSVSQRQSDSTSNFILFGSNEKLHCIREWQSRVGISKLVVVVPARAQSFSSDLNSQVVDLVKDPSAVRKNAIAVRIFNKIHYVLSGAIP